MKIYGGAGVVAGLVLGAASVVQACWVAVPLNALVAQRPVIVTGKIEKIERAQEPKEGEADHAGDTAFITVTKVVKNTLPGTGVKVGDKLTLVMPSVNRKVHVSTEIAYTEGTDGIWLLKVKDGKYVADYPGDLQPKAKESEIVKLVEGAGK